MKYYTKQTFNRPASFHFHGTALFTADSTASHSCHRNEKQSPVIGVKRVLKSQGTCQNIQSVTQSLANLFLPRIPFPQKSPPLQDEPRTELESGSEGRETRNWAFQLPSRKLPSSPLLLGINSVNTQLPSPCQTREATAPPPDHRLCSTDPVGVSLVRTISLRLHMQTQRCMGLPGEQYVLAKLISFKNISNFGHCYQYCNFLSLVWQSLPCPAKTCAYYTEGRLRE